MNPLLAFLVGCYTPPLKHVEHRVIDGVKYDCMCSLKESTAPVCEDLYCFYDQSYECRCLKHIETPQTQPHYKWGIYQ